MRWLLAWVLGVWIVGAQAEIYKHVDANGVVTYTDYPMRGAQRLHIGKEGANWGKAGVQPATGHASYARENVVMPAIETATQKKRDNLRRDVLQDELTKEQQALDQAKSALAKADDSDAPAGSAAWRTKQVKLSDAVRLHTDNVEALQRELQRIH